MVMLASKDFTAEKSDLQWLHLMITGSTEFLSIRTRLLNFGGLVSSVELKSFQ